MPDIFLALLISREKCVWCVLRIDESVPKCLRCIVALFIKNNLVHAQSTIPFILVNRNFTN